MELRHLRGFVAVAEELHFGRAATRLHMAQPPLSQQIRLLERDLGVQLFDRSTRSVKLTSAGEVLLGPAREVLAAAAVAQRAALASSRGEIGRVRVGFAGASSYDALPRLARAVTSELPGIHLVLKGQTYSGEALRQLAAGELEIGFISARDTIPGVSMRTVHVENLVAALPDSHALAGQDSIDLAALAGEWFVAFPSGAGSAIREESERLCHGAGFAPRVAQEAPDAYNLLTLVGAGVGVALVVESSQHICLDTVVYRPLVKESAPLRIALAWNATGASPAVQAVLRVAESVLPTPPTKTT